MQYIIGSKNPAGTFSVAPNPKVHAEYSQAEAEANRLARLDKNKEFFVFQLVSSFKQVDVAKTVYK